MGKRKYNHEVGMTYIITSTNASKSRLWYQLVYIIEITPEEKYIIFVVSGNSKDDRFFISTRRLSRQSMNSYARSGVSLERFCPDSNRLRFLMVYGISLDSMVEKIRKTTAKGVERYRKYKGTRYRYKIDPNNIKIDIPKKEE